MLTSATPDYLIEWQEEWIQGAPSTRFAALVAKGKTTLRFLLSLHQNQARWLDWSASAVRFALVPYMRAARHKSREM